MRHRKNDVIKGYCRDQHKDEGHLYLHHVRLRQGCPTVWLNKLTEAPASRHRLSHATRL